MALILIPGTHEYVKLYGKRDPAAMIKLKILRWEIILGYLAGSKITTRVLIKKKKKRSKRIRL